MDEAADTEIRSDISKVLGKSRYSGRGATYERDAFGRTINLVEAGGVGGIARRRAQAPN